MDAGSGDGLVNRVWGGRGRQGGERGSRRQKRRERERERGKYQYII